MANISSFVPDYPSRELTARSISSLTDGTGAFEFLTWSLGCTTCQGSFSKWSGALFEIWSLL